PVGQSAQSLDPQQQLLIGAAAPVVRAAAPIVRAAAPIVRAAAAAPIVRAAAPIVRAVVKPVIEGDDRDFPHLVRDSMFSSSDRTDILCRNCTTGRCSHHQALSLLSTFLCIGIGRSN
uniref:Secreted protein n=1 Tax=Macrostomum lignano TaxID=282301 RepID=A0A1I8FVZ2_9PLAT